MRRRLTNSTLLTEDILRDNGWRVNDYAGYATFYLLIEYSDVALGDSIHLSMFNGQMHLEFASCTIGHSFTTVGELRAIGKALFKTNLPFYAK